MGKGRPKTPGAHLSSEASLFPLPRGEEQRCLLCCGHIGLQENHSERMEVLTRLTSCFLIGCLLSQQTLCKVQTISWPISAEEKHNERLLAKWREPIFLPFGVAKMRPGLYQRREAGLSLITACLLIWIEYLFPSKIHMLKP